jgi:hypothetical protein
VWNSDSTRGGRSALGNGESMGINSLQVRVPGDGRQEGCCASTPCSRVPVFRHGRWVLLTDDGLVIPTQVAGSTSFAEIRAAS